MSQKQSIVFVAFLVLGLAAVAMSANVSKIDISKTFGSAFGEQTCKQCEDFFYKSMVPLSKFKPQLELLCQYYTNEAEIQKCIKIMDDSIAHLEEETPLEICQSIGMCKKD